MQVVEGPRSDLVVFVGEFDRLGSGHDELAGTVKLLSDRAFPLTIVMVGVGEDVGDLLAAHQSVGRNLAQVYMPRMTAHEIGQIVTTEWRALASMLPPRCCAT